ncbi:hypothetical protein ILUMI_10556, partial [Ignelater luminosus]
FFFENQTAVLAAVAHNPHVGFREVFRNSGISRTSVWRILKNHKFYRYHISIHQELHGDDFNNRVVFCNWALTQTQRDPQFFYQVMFYDLSTFTNHGDVNRHNMHGVWNTHTGYVKLSIRTLNGEKYRNLLQDELPILLEDVPLEVLQNMWFQHDACPAHYSAIPREMLNSDYSYCWVGRGGPTNWPVRSPYLTSTDFFLWCYLKEKVYTEILEKTWWNVLEAPANK